jgi:hypothetical protein
MLGLIQPGDEIILKLSFDGRPFWSRKQVMIGISSCSSKLSKIQTGRDILPLLILDGDEEAALWNSKEMAGVVQLRSFLPSDLSSVRLSSVAVFF